MSHVYGKMPDDTAMKEDVILKKLEEVVKEVRDIKSDIEVKLNQYIAKTDNVIKILNNEINEVRRPQMNLKKVKNSSITNLNQTSLLWTMC